MLGSNWRRLPAAAFLGLAKSGRPSISLILFNFLKPFLDINTSPRTSNNGGEACTSVRKESGIAEIVFKF